MIIFLDKILENLKTPKGGKKIKRKTKKHKKTNKKKTNLISNIKLNIINQLNVLYNSTLNRKSS